LEILNKVFTTIFNSVMEPVIELRILILSLYLNGCVLLLSDKESVLAENILAEIRGQLSSFLNLDNKVHSLPDQFLWGVRD
jgi:hypothetical protein